MVGYLSPQDGGLDGGDRMTDEPGPSTGPSDTPSESGPPIPVPAGAPDLPAPLGEAGPSSAPGAIPGADYHENPIHLGGSAWPGAPVAGTSAPASHRLRVAALMGGALVLLAAGVGIGHTAWKNSPPVTSASSSANAGHPSFGSLPPFGSAGGSGPGDVSSIAAKVDPGLVDINTSLGYQSVQAAGTGIVLSPSGEILTNNHVIDGATSISVTDVGNQQTYTASVVGYDRTHDIAVLQLHNASGLQTASIGNSSNVAVGEAVVGIGNAGGTGGTPSAAGGTVDALNQSISASDRGDGSSEQLTGLISTNAAIEAGDSGGPLVNTSGAVIGMDTAASAGFSFQAPDQSSGNQGFAIPINEAISTAREIASGNATATVHIGATAFLGIEIQATSFGDGGGPFGGGTGGGSSGSGAAVSGVVTSSPAQEAGLAQGDVITSVNNTATGSPSALTDALSPFHPGDTVKIGWVDSTGVAHSANVQLSSGPPQ